MKDPGSIFVFQSGGFGDIVLTSQLTGALKRSDPAKRIVLGIDSFFQDLPALFPIPPDEVFALNLAPLTFLNPEPEVYGALRAIGTRLAEYRVDTFIDAAHRPRWFSLFMAAALRPPKTVCGPLDSAGERALEQVLAEFRLPKPIVIAPDLPRKLSEPERHRLLAGFVCGSTWPDLEWTVAASGDRAALDWLRASNIPPAGYILCSPFGSPGVPMKQWPLKRFIDVLNQVGEEEGLSVVFAGSRAEVYEMQSASAALRVPSKVYFGPDLSMLAGLVFHAKAFLGNDSGLAHLAQALKTNGVIVFGGGTWPFYAPWAPGMTGVTHSLPCFGCYWDCLFDHAFCVDQISSSAVAEQLRASLHSVAPAPRVVDISVPDGTRDNMIRRADARYRAVTRNYLETGNELQRVLREAERRAQAIEDMARELDSVRTEAERRGAALEEMNRELLAVYSEAELRSRALEQVSRELDGFRARRAAK